MSMMMIVVLWTRRLGDNGAVVVELDERAEFETDLEIGALPPLLMRND